METNHIDKQQLISLCNNEYQGNSDQLAIVREFETKYTPKKALWWYSRESFLYKILNKALRTQNIDVLYLFRSIISDIYQQLEQNRCRSFVRVYRGQIMSTDEIYNLQHSVNNFISINSFLSTSTSQQGAMGFLYQTKITDNMHRVMFEIDADPRLTCSKPFANISKSSFYSNEQEILFMIGCVFSLIDVRKTTMDNMWIVQMRLCGDNEHNMKKLFEYMKRDYGGGDTEVDILAFGRVLRAMGKFDLAEKFYRRLLHGVPSNDPSLCNLYYSLGVVMMDTGDYDSSLEWFYKSLDIAMRTNPSDYVNIGSRYCCIGVIYSKKNEYIRSLTWYKTGINLFKQANDSDHLSVARFYNNMALVYNEQEKYFKALEFYRQALTIYEKHLPPDHPDIGTTYDNIGIIYRCLKEYDLARKYHNQSLQIRQTSLPSYHPLIAFSYRNIGLLLENKSELTEALEYLQKAVTIYRQSLSVQHPDVRKTEQDIQRVNFKLK